MRTLLEENTTKELLCIAKELGIVGRHEMRKQQLVNAIAEVEDKKELSKELPEEETLKRPKSDYVDNARVGIIIAFKVNEQRMLSGMIREIHSHEFIVETKNGVRFNVKFKNVAWVKTGDRWPKGVYLALKGESLCQQK